ncbi:hypothetical protein K470DRAFT_253937 [Piedraia hortae CBS 480.64]|uniref:Uncharacterized protein n=1 Tax=Piedraia hortae CBS 480.64 TaxID=1314780 RepID=A0A6A7CAN0_9PEZI|nr:hypothetical protein K470DRAFT_253937 [Piedraia hortae CBS 480.64]
MPRSGSLEIRLPSFDSLGITTPTPSLDSVSAVSLTPKGSSSMAEGGPDALEDALKVLRRCMSERAAPPGYPLRLLSHALPCPNPSLNGNILPVVIDAMQSASLPCTNVFHALSGRFTLSDLPTSPPATPILAGTDDYFAQKVFDSAVPVSDYSQDLSTLPRSPHPVVPPASIDVAVVERFIPPPSAAEFANMFNLNGPSILVDRLVELSPQNGCLLFVYPTRTGARTFMREHLGPVWDPILRSTSVVYDLPLELSRKLGAMQAVEQLDEHEELESKVRKLCDRMRQVYRHPARFEVVYAGCGERNLSKERWVGWWAKQERSRIRDVAQHYIESTRRHRHYHQDPPMHAAELVMKLIQHLDTKQYPAGFVPGGVEVSVFAIQRCR